MRETAIRKSMMKSCVKYTTSDRGNLELQNLQEFLDYCHRRLDRLFLHLNLFDPQVVSFKTRFFENNELTNHRLGNFVSQK